MSVVAVQSGTATVGQRAGQARVAVENDNAVARRAADELRSARSPASDASACLTGGFAGPLDQHLDLAADESALSSSLISFEWPAGVVAAALHLFGNVVGVMLERLRSRPRAVFEDKAVFEPAASRTRSMLASNSASVSPRIADDEVARHGAVRHRFSRMRHVHLEILLDRVAALHHARAPCSTPTWPGTCR